MIVRKRSWAGRRNTVGETSKTKLCYSRRHAVSYFIFLNDRQTSNLIENRAKRLLMRLHPKSSRRTLCAMAKLQVYDMLGILN